MIENLFLVYAIFAFFSLGATLGLFTRRQKYHSYLTYVPSTFASLLTIILSLAVFSSEKTHVTFFNVQHLFDFVRHFSF